MAADKSYPYEQRDLETLRKQRLTAALWSKVPSFGNDLRKVKIESCKGFNAFCVHTSTIAKTLTLPAASSFKLSCPARAPLKNWFSNLSKKDRSFKEYINFNNFKSRSERV